MAVHYRMGWLDDLFYGHYKEFTNIGKEKGEQLVYFLRDAVNI